MLLSYTEFKASVNNIGLKDTCYFARQLGVSLTQVLLWIHTK